MITPREMKCAAAITIASIAFVSETFGVLRPLFPAKSAPPFNGEAMIIGNDRIQKASATAPK